MASKLKRKLLTAFGDIKLIKFPLFMYYQPGDYYKTTGAEGRRAQELLAPGDIILRGYDSYLDGYFIPGEYSHSGIYIGRGKVVHAVAEGVSEIDLLDFLRCDRFAVCRPRKGTALAIKTARKLIGTPYDFDFKPDNDSFYCHEFSAFCYSKILNIPKITPYLGWIRFAGLQPAYLAESFLTSPDFKLVLTGGNSKINAKKEEVKTK